MRIKLFPHVGQQKGPFARFGHSWSGSLDLSALQRTKKGIVFVIEAKPRGAFRRLSRGR